MIERTIDDLRAIALDADDAAGYFPAMYSRVTRNVATAIEHGRFDDNERMERFAMSFADYYMRARSDPEASPRCWQACWDVSADGGLLIVQHLILGINAHVNHDLPQVVVDLSPDRDTRALRQDFNLLNDILASTFDEVLADLDAVSRWTNKAAALGGGRLFNFSLQTARNQAWAAAERIARLDDDGRRAYVQQLDELVAVLAFLVTRPPFPVRVAAKLARRLEERDAHKVTRKLLG